MNNRIQFVSTFIFLVFVIGACALPGLNIETQPSSSSSDQEAATVTTNLLPYSLYFLAKDNQSISQIYRMEHDGKTITQLTFEPFNVTDYDVSMADGSVAYVASNQLLLVHADGLNRRVLIDGGTGSGLRGFYNPVFSPNGQTLAYSRNGINLYAISTGVSDLVLEDHPLGGSLPPEIYTPDIYSPDGTKLLITIGYPPDSPATAAIYFPIDNTLIQFAGRDESPTCCNFYGGPVWSPDSASFYGVARQYDSSYRFGELWKVNAGNGAVTKMLNENDGIFNLPKELYLAPDGQLYFFFGSYDLDSGLFDAPALNLVRSAPDGLTHRTVLRDENFALMKEALWAPDASFVIVASGSEQNGDPSAGVLELYYTDGQKSAVWLAPFGEEMRWGP